MMRHCPITEIQSAEVRTKRNALLAASDWTQLQDAPTELAEQWKEYRQALRDIPQQEGFPFNVVFPTRPE